MAYFLTIVALVALSAYSHIQFRADVQDDAYRVIASEHQNTIQFSQLNTEDATMAPEQLQGIAVDTKKRNKPDSN